MTAPLGCVYPWTMVSPDTIVVPAALGCQWVSPNPGGGGLGHEPDKEFLQRYEGHYQGRYRSAYKSTLRKG